METPIVKQAIKAYRQVVVSPEFREYERLRNDARHNEASALLNAKRIGYQEAAIEFQGIITEQAAALANRAAELAGKDAVLANQAAELAGKAAALADQVAKLADKDAEIARLRAMLEKGNQTRQGGE
jgi:hypothetical protein